jgi:2,4-dienoyl-CoA reductase (NADPH2)
MEKENLLFTPFRIGRLRLKNRITMTPLHLGYANQEGAVTELLLAHYREMADSGAAVIVVENAGIAASGLGSPSMLRADSDSLLDGLTQLSRAIHDQGALAFLQLNHAGRYAYGNKRLAPSPVPLGEITPKEMSQQEIRLTVEAFAAAAARTKEAGFDGAELHGGTGYLLAQFISPRTNRREDNYGGSAERRMQFPLEVYEAVRAAVGDYPVGYRFIVDELLPAGLHGEEAIPFAKELASRGVAYLSTMVGVHEAFALPNGVAMDRTEGGQSPYAARIREKVPGTPIITAGRIQTPETAEMILREGRADLIGLARVLFADPLWPKKAAGEIRRPIVPCSPTCSLCTSRVRTTKPAICAQWEKERRRAFLEALGDKGSEPE